MDKVEKLLELASGSLRIISLAGELINSGEMTDNRIAFQKFNNKKENSKAKSQEIDDIFGDSDDFDIFSGKNDYPVNKKQKAKSQSMDDIFSGSGDDGFDIFSEKNDYPVNKKQKAKSQSMDDIFSESGDDSFDIFSDEKDNFCRPFKGKSPFKFRLNVSFEFEI